MKRVYVDDTFCLFDTEHDTTLFYDCINDRHSNVCFTMEKEMDKKIPRLDVLIDNSQPQSPVNRWRFFIALNSLVPIYTPERGEVLCE